VIVAALAATFTVGFLFGCCAASVVFWMFPRAQGVLPEGVKGAVNKAGKPKDDMTFQELEDRLNVAGCKVSRLESRSRANAMWFGDETKFTGEWTMRSTIAFWENATMPSRLYDHDHFLVTK
jgi:hypothetical protein